MDLKEDYASDIDITCKTPSSEYFDEVIGHIEDIVMSEKFQILHKNFLESNWQSIETTEENKLEYMDIFKEYTDTLENFIIHELQNCMEDFDMDLFTEQLETHGSFTDSLANGEIFELLYSFTNFLAFKEIMLDYRSEKEGNLEHLECDILITKSMHTDDMAVSASTSIEKNSDEQFD